MSKNRDDIYTRVTNQIIEAIEAGTGSFRMPWHHDGSAITRPVNIASDRRYRGGNTLVLWAAATKAGYSSGLWGTYRQWAASGAQVRRGERATSIMFWKPVERREDDGANGSNQDNSGSKRFFARGFSVFNRDQVDGHEERAPTLLAEDRRIVHAETFFDGLGIPVTYGAGSAFYRIGQDRIFMPNFSAFVDPVSFYGVLYHEAAHGTGAKHRLDRVFGKRFDQHATALEEVVAELTAAFVLADLRLSYHPREDHAVYVASWLAALKDEPRAIFTAASKAQAAADWMHAQQPEVLSGSDEKAA